MRTGSRLSQIRFRTGNALLSEAELHGAASQPRRWSPPSRRTFPAAASRCRSTSTATTNGLVGYRGKHHTGLVDVDKRAAQDVLDFWEPLYKRGAGELVLDPDEFYILVSAARRCTCRRSTPPR